MHLLRRPPPQAFSLKVVASAHKVTIAQAPTLRTAINREPTFPILVNQAHTGSRLEGTRFLTIVVILDARRVLRVTTARATDQPTLQSALRAGTVILERKLQGLKESTAQWDTTAPTVLSLNAMQASSRIRSAWIAAHPALQATNVQTQSTMVV